MWPVRPNESTTQEASSYNVYWDSASGGLFSSLLASVSNQGSSIRSYYKKVVVHIIPSQVPGWDNEVANYVKLKAVVLGIEQAFENVVTIVPYTNNGMRLHYPELRTNAIIGYNKAEDRFIPVSVDTDGKVETI